MVLNHQVEHHIFPHISHVHYKKSLKLLKKLQKNLIYLIMNIKRQEKLLQISHFQHLKELGKKPAFQYQ